MGAPMVEIMKARRGYLESLCLVGRRPTNSPPQELAKKAARRAALRLVGPYSPLHEFYHTNTNELEEKVMMNTADRQLGFSKDKSREALRKSLDSLEHRYGLAVQEWQQQSSKLVVEKDVPQPAGSSKHLPKRLPKLVTASDNNGNKPLEKVTKEKLIQVVSVCRVQEMQVRALEQTLDSHRKKLESERNQQLHLQHQLNTLLHRKEEAQKLAQKVNTALQRQTPSADIAERALAESAKRLASIDEEAVRIRREAIDLQQKHQVRNKIQEQVEAFGSRITVLEEKKMKAVKRMRCLQGEEARLFQHMNGAVRKVCAQQRENTVKLDGEYQIIWSNVELLLGYCDKLLQMTRPEIEALKLDADKNVESNGMQPLVSISQCEIIENHSTVTSADTQSDAFVTQAQSPGQDITQHEDFPQTVESNTVSVVEKVHEESHIASMGNGSQFDVKNAGMHYEYISNEDHHGDIVVDNQELESAKVMSVASLPVQCKQPLPDEAELDLNTHSTQELHIERPSVMMTQDKKNNTIAESSSSPIYQDDAIATSLETSSENEVLLTDTSVKFVEAQHVSKLNDAEYFSSSQCKPSDLHASVVAPIVSDGVVEANIYVPVPHHNEMSMSDEGTILHISYTGSTAPSFSSMYQLCGSHNSTSSPFHTVSALAHVKGKAKKDKEDPIHRENEEEDNPVLAPEVIHEKEIDASGNQVGTSSSLTEQNEIVNIASACHVPGNLNVMLTEEQSPQSNALHPDNLNMTRPTTVDEELSADCISSNGKLNTTSII